MGGLEANVFTVADPEGGAKSVVAAMVGLGQGDAREGTVGIELAVGIFYQEQRRVAALLEGLGPDGVVVVVVIIGTRERHVKECASGELCVEVYPLPAHVDIETVGEFRTVASAKIAFIVLVNLAVAVKIHISYVSQIGTGAVPGRCINLFFRAV